MRTSRLFSKAIRSLDICFSEKKSRNGMVFAKTVEQSQLERRKTNSPKKRKPKVEKKSFSKKSLI